MHIKNCCEWSSFVFFNRAEIWFSMIVSDYTFLKIRRLRQKIIQIEAKESIVYGIIKEKILNVFS